MKQHRHKVGDVLYVKAGSVIDIDNTAFFRDLIDGFYPTAPIVVVATPKDTPWVTVMCLGQKSNCNAGRIEKNAFLEAVKDALAKAAQ